MVDIVVSRIVNEMNMRHMHTLEYYCVHC
jgi:hypothetical protein